MVILKTLVDGLSIQLSEENATSKYTPKKEPRFCRVRKEGQGSLAELYFLQVDELLYLIVPNNWISSFSQVKKNDANLERFIHRLVCRACLHCVLRF